MTSPLPAPHAWVLYDDACGICRRWVLFWAPTLRRRGYGIAPLQAQWVGERLHLPTGVLLENIRLLRADGTQIAGPDVYRHIMRSIWWTYPVFLLACAPLLRGLFNLSYHTFAANRFRFSRACGLDVPRTPPTS